MPTASEPRRLPELDGIRGIAIGLVLIWHYFILPADPAPGSFLAHALALGSLTWTGVDLFFVLSGFLIGGILLDARKASNYFVVFYRRRFFRIVPPYVALLVVFAVLDRIATGSIRGDLYWVLNDHLPWFAYWTFTQNLWMSPFVVLGANSLAITWSLAIEEQFYLALPLVMRLFSGRNLLYCIVTGIVLAPLTRLAILLLISWNWVAAFALMPCRADALLLGVLAAILIRDDRWKARIQRANLFFAISFAVLLAGVVFLAWKSPVLKSPLMMELGFTWIAAFYVTVLLFAVTRPDSLLSRALRISSLRWLGTIAYGVYLLHQTVQGLLFAFVRHGEPKITGILTLATSVVALALTLLIARLSWHFFERPLMNIGHRSHYKFSASPTEQLAPAVAQ